MVCKERKIIFSVYTGCISFLVVEVHIPSMACRVRTRVRGRRQAGEHRELASPCRPPRRRSSHPSPRSRVPLPMYCIIKVILQQN